MKQTKIHLERSRGRFANSDKTKIILMITQPRNGRLLYMGLHRFFFVNKQQNDGLGPLVS